jgi:hypothetical protein
MDYDMALNNSIISGKDLYNKLNNAIKKAPLNVNNVSLNGLKEQLNNRAKKNSVLNIMDSDTSTVADTLDLEYNNVNLDSVELVLTNLIIVNLHRVDNIIYNKLVTDTLEPLFKFNNHYFNNYMVYCYNYKKT